LTNEQEEPTSPDLYPIAVEQVRVTLASWIRYVILSNAGGAIAVLGYIGTAQSPHWLMSVALDFLSDFSETDAVSMLGIYERVIRRIQAGGVHFSVIGFLTFPAAAIIGLIAFLSS
jgi:hypothetical protein